jgi:hypothetical protein
MSGSRKGLLLGAIQIALVLSLGGKLLYDRVTRPRVWVLSQVYDPDLPIRGRYLSEQLRLPAEGFSYKDPEQRNGNPYQNRQWGYFEVRDGQLIAKPQGSGSAGWVHVQKNNNDGGVFALTEEPVLFFVAERAEIPTLKSGQEMWVEVTVPAQGPPRPIRIAVKQNDALTPLKLD